MAARRSPGSSTWNFLLLFSGFPLALLSMMMIGTDTSTYLPWCREIDQDGLVVSSKIKRKRGKEGYHFSCLDEARRRGLNTRQQCFVHVMSELGGAHGGRVGRHVVEGAQFRCYATAHACLTVAKLQVDCISAYIREVTMLLTSSLGLTDRLDSGLVW